MTTLDKTHDKATTRAHNALAAFVDAADELDVAAEAFQQVHDEHMACSTEHAVRAEAAQAGADAARAKSDKIREFLR